MAEIKKRSKKINHQNLTRRHTRYTKGLYMTDRGDNTEMNTIPFHHFREVKDIEKVFAYDLTRKKMGRNEKQDIYKENEKKQISFNKYQIQILLWYHRSKS